MIDDWCASVNGPETRDKVSYKNAYVISYAEKISHLQRNQIERRSVTSRYHGSTISGWQKTQRRRRRQGEKQKKKKESH